MKKKIKLCEGLQYKYKKLLIITKHLVLKMTDRFERKFSSSFKKEI